MKFSEFTPLKDETILLQLHPNRRWYAIAWKITSYFIIVAVVTLMIFTFFSESITTILESIIPGNAAPIISNVLVFGIIPLLVTAWAAEDVAATFTGETILTNRRLWLRGCPYAWAQIEVPLEDIGTMTFRRDAIFIRRKSTRKILVVIIAEGKHLVEVYQNISKQ